MRAADLTPGQDYLYATANKWVEYGDGQRVRVLDAGRWLSRGRRIGSDPRVAPPEVTLSDGTKVRTWHIRHDDGLGRADGVLVIGVGPVKDRWGTVSNAAPSVVDARYLRGPWEAATAQVAEYRQQRDDARRRDAERAATAQERAAAAQARLVALVPSAASRISRYWAGDVDLDVRDLERLLDLAEVGQRAQQDAPQ